jgi:hypothetical protein
MIALRIAVFALTTLVFAGVVALVMVTLWVRAHTLYPGPQNESAFLKAYSPQSVVDRFKCTDCGVERVGGMGTAAGRKFVKRTANYDQTFSLRPEQQIELVEAMRADVLARLGANRARVLRQTANSHEGVRIEYLSDTSLGMVSILPIEVTAREGTSKVQPGFEQVSLHVIIDERWYPEEARAQDASIQPMP